MNIESVLYKINLFEELVIDSGLRRNVNDYIQSIQQPQNRNLTFMKDLSAGLKLDLAEIENNSLANELKIILKDSSPFTELNTIAELNLIDNDSSIDAGSYFQRFNIILNQLFQSIDTNKTELDNVKIIFSKYVSDSSKYEKETSSGIISLIFKDLQTTSNLKEFSKALARWNRTLVIYHSLLKSESPEDINLLEIQNGSIDVIFNIDFDVALDLTELIKYGMKVYAAYLVYKSETAKQIILSYMGNKKLIEGEKEREKLMLENIKECVEDTIREQHKKRSKGDKKIDKTSIDAKVKDVSEVVTDHIIKGNEMKLLNSPKNEISEDETENIEDPGTELRIITALAREYYNKLNDEQKQLLLEKYSIKEKYDNKEDGK
jgi:hypothetical protein